MGYEGLKDIDIGTGRFSPYTYSKFFSPFLSAGKIMV